MSLPIVSIYNLQDFYFSGNIPRIRILTADPIQVTIDLLSSNGFSITELHQPRLNEDIVLDINTLIHKHLTAKWTDNPADLYSFELWNYLKQIDNYASVTISAEGHAPVSFFVNKGIVDAPDNFNFKQYAQDNLLNVCPQIIKVGYNDPYTVNYYTFSTSTIKLQAKILTGFSPDGSPLYSTVNHDYLSLNSQDNLHTIKANFATLAENFSLGPDHIIIHIDIWATNSSPSGKTATIRLVPDPTNYFHNDIFAFENSLGGIEIIRFTGVLSKIPDHDYLALHNQNQTLEYETLTNTKYEKNTGFLVTNEQAAFANDFLASNNRYHYKNGSFERIFVTGKNANFQKGKLSNYWFTFSYATNNYATLLNRKTTL